MANWDVFHVDRLELERSLSAGQVRAALARGDLRDDDLVRPAGSSAVWARIGDRPDLFTGPEPEAEAEAEAEATRALEPTIADAPTPFREVGPSDDDDDVEFVELDPDAPRPPSSPFVVGEHQTIPSPAPPPRDRGGAGPYGELDLNPRHLGPAEIAPPESSVELVTGGPVDEIDDDDEEEEYDPLEEDEAVAEFTLARGAAERVEELDLAAMVDVAFQMVLFFLVTATTVLYKTLEVPRPNPEDRPTAAAAQGRPKTLDDLKDDFILVEIDPEGAVKVDHDPVPAEMMALAERLRSERARTGRKAMLLSADFTTPHRNAVLAYDAANEIGLGIAIARPTRGPSPPPRAGPGAPES